MVRNPQRKKSNILKKKKKEKKVSLQAEDWIFHTYSSSYNPSQWVPCSFIKPIQKLIEAMWHKMMSWTIIKPEIKTRRNLKQQQQQKKQKHWSNQKVPFTFNGKPPTP